MTCYATVNGHQIIAGCWSGTVDELEARISKPEEAWAGTDEDERKLWLADYQGVIALFRPRIKEWEAEA